MKITFLLTLFLTVISCHQITNPGSKTVEAQSSKSPNKNLSGSNSAVVSVPNKTSQPLSETAPFLVWVNVITLEKLKSPSAVSVWVNGKLEKTPVENGLKKVFTVDIMNCAGYLATGELSKSADYGWNFKLTPRSLANDAVVKMRRCAVEAQKEEGFISNFVFAIAPANGNRRNITLGKTDTTKLIASLPTDTKKWLNSSYNLSEKVRQKMFCRCKPTIIGRTLTATGKLI